MRIFRYVLAVTDYQTVGMPEGANVLAVQMKGSELCLWAVVDPDRPSSSLAVRIVDTGNPFHDAIAWDGCYLGTVQQGQFVWHVFVRQP